MHIIVIALIFLSLGYALTWAWNQPKDKLQAMLSEITTPFVAEKLPDMATPLKQWAQASLGQETLLQTWLLNLPDEGLQALGEKIAEFSHDMEVDLDWLLKPEVETNPIAKQAAEEMVIDYCKLCLKAVQQQRHLG